MADIYISDSFLSKENEKSSVQEHSNKNVPFKFRKSSRVSSLSPFGFLPRNVNFETRNKEEKVVLLLRKHPIVNLRWVLIALLMIFAPLTLGYFPIVDFLPPNFRFASIVGWYLITFAFVFESFLSWFFDVNIVTDERIVDIDFHNLIYKVVAETDIDKIQDITFKVGSVVRTIFDYGDVYIQTASGFQNFEFLSVPHPSRVVKILQELKNEEKQEELEGRVS